MGGARIDHHDFRLAESTRLAGAGSTCPLQVSSSGSREECDPFAVLRVGLKVPALRCHYRVVSAFSPKKPIDYRHFSLKLVIIGQ
jgi:hypothetical protein